MIAQISLSLLIAIFFIMVVFLYVSCHIINNQAGEQFEIREVPPSPPPPPPATLMKRVF